MKSTPRATNEQGEKRKEKGERNAERGMMNDELSADSLGFIFHRSAFIIIHRSAFVISY
jgi:hypothetical protein